MKIIVLLLALILCIGVASKNTADSVKQISERSELSTYKNHPNLLPVVEVSAPRA